MPSSNRTTHYHRFIPSEEVVEVAAWEFAPMDGSVLSKTAVEPEVAAPAPEPQALEEAREQAYQQGFDDGKLAGAQEARQALEPVMKQEIQQLAKRLDKLVQQAQGDISRLEETLSAQLLELACDLARQVVRAELSTAPETLRAVVNEALALAVEDGRPATVRVHPQDAEWLQTGWTDGPATVKLVADDSIAPGGCVVECSQGAVDATVEKRWARAVANLGLQAPWNPGEQADV